MCSISFFHFEICFNSFDFLFMFQFCFNSFRHSFDFSFCKSFSLARGLVQVGSPYFNFLIFIIFRLLSLIVVFPTCGDFMVDRPEIGNHSC